MLTREAFARGLSELCAIYDKEMSPAAIGGYFEALRHCFDDLTFGDAVRAVIATAEHFPRPAELIEAGGKASDDAALSAWETALSTLRHQGIYRSVDMGGAANAAVRLLGGWPKLGATPVAELHWRQKDFMQAFSHYAKVGTSVETGAYLPGINEAQCVADGHEAPPVQVVGPDGRTVKEIAAGPARLLLVEGKGR